MARAQRRVVVRQSEHFSASVTDTRAAEAADVIHDLSPPAFGADPEYALKTLATLGRRLQSGIPSSNEPLGEDGRAKIDVPVLNRGFQ